jgi:hypothetical protein
MNGNVYGDESSPTLSTNKGEGDWAIRGRNPTNTLSRVSGLQQSKCLK